jgi:pimeloyl-ACP methyl ester carboxylesterase
VAWCDRFRERLPVAARERDVETSFGRTHVLDAGPEGAPPFVVLHGALASSAHLLPELSALTKDRRIVAVDVLGQSALSDDRRIDVRDGSYGRWLVEVVDALGLDHFDLLGVSWGGFVAKEAAKAAPERVRHLVLMVPAGFVASSAWAGFRDVGWPLLAYRAFPSEARLERLVGALLTDPDEHWTRYLGDAVRSYRLDMRIPPLERDLSSIRCPTLVYGAEHDASFPGGALLARARELLPHAETELLLGSKHSPPMTPAFRARTAERLDRFLSS